MKCRKTVVGLVVAGGVLLGSGGASGAAPKSDPIALDCGDGVIEVVVNGGGWSPAFVSGTKTKFFPTAFDGFTGVEYDEEGNPGEPFTEDFTDSKAAPRGVQVVDCTFSFTEFGENGQPVFSGSGGVSGYFR